MVEASDKFWVDIGINSKNFTKSIKALSAIT